MPDQLDQLEAFLASLGTSSAMPGISNAAPGLRELRILALAPAVEVVHVVYVE